MFRLSFRVLALAVSVAATGTVTAGGDDDAVMSNRIAGYRQWTKVNPEPVKVETPANTKRIFLGGG